MSNDIQKSVNNLGMQVKGTASQAMILQGHANLIEQQSMVNLQGFDKLVQYQTGINGAITSAQSHSNDYLTIILPKMITTTTNIDRYFNLQNALAQAINANTTAKECTALIGAVMDQASEYKSEADDIGNRLRTLNTNFNTDTQNFKSFVTNMNSAVEGDNGVLASIDEQVGTYDQQIAGAATAIGLGGLAVIGGGFMVAVGAIGELVTAGTSTTLVIAGVGVAVAGVAAVTAGGILLANALDGKGDLLAKKANLQAEVAYALSLKSNFSTIAGSCMSASKAAGEMSSAWDTMGGHMKNLVVDLESGRTNVGAIRNLFLTSAESDVKNILTDNRTIQQQLAGVNVVNLGSKGLSSVIRQEMKIAA